MLWNASVLNLVNFIHTALLRFTFYNRVIQKRPPCQKMEQCMSWPTGPSFSWSRCWIMLTQLGPCCFYMVNGIESAIYDNLQIMAIVVRFDPLLWYHDRFFIRCVCFWFSGEQAAPSEAVDVKKSKLKLADYISE